MWGSSAVLIKEISAQALVLAFYRLWFAIPFLWLVILFSPGIRRSMSWKWALGCLLGGSLFSLHQISFISAIKTTSVANVTVIASLQPVLVLLVGGPLFGEFLRRRDLVWAMVALGGTLLVLVGSMDSPVVSWSGDLLAFANLFAFTAYFLVSRWVRSEVSSWAYVVGMTTVSGFVIALTSAARGVTPVLPEGWAPLYLFLLALFPGTLGHVLMNWAHAHVTAFSISMILLAAPVVSSAAAWFFLGETLSLLQAFGAAVVLVAIGIIVRGAEAGGGQELAESAAETEAL